MKSPETHVDDGVVLDVREVVQNFGGVRALDGVSLQVRDRTIVAIVGPNGAGKSSLLNCINGLYRPSSGSIRFKGKEISHYQTHQLAGLGIARTFQNINLYPGMSTADNVMTGRSVHMRTGVARSIIRPWGQRDERRQRVVVNEIIDDLGLGRFRDSDVEKLGYGIRKRIDLARAVAIEPKVLLLDEPMAGMNTEEKVAMVRSILAIREKFGCAVVFVEHDMGVVSDLADYAYVLDWGRLIGEGRPSEVLRQPDVIAAYLGAGVSK